MSRDALTERWFHCGLPWCDRPGMIYAGSEDPHAGTFVADCGSWSDELFFGERPTLDPAAIAELIVRDHNAAPPVPGAGLVNRRQIDPLDVTDRERTPSPLIVPPARPVAPLLGFILVALSGALVGLVAGFLLAGVVSAAVPATSEVLAASAMAGGGSSAASLVPGAPQADAGSVRSTSRGASPSAPVPAVPEDVEPTGEIGTAIEGGIAAYADPSFGPLYLALPEGPGARVTICGPADCVTRTSTDAGPDLSMQRQGRVADLSYDDFATVCGCRPEVVGLVRVTIERGGPGVTPPATDR